MAETMHPALIDYLSANAGVSALVGTRIRPMKAHSSDALPYIVFHKLANVHYASMLAPDELARSTYEFECFSNTAKGAVSLHEAVRDALDGYSSATFGSGADEIDLRIARLEREDESYIEPEEGSQVGKYVVRQDWTFIYVESLPSY